MIWMLLVASALLPMRAAVSSEFGERRAALRKAIPDGVVVLFGSNESSDLHEPFFQQTDFYYLTGWQEPGAILLMSPEREFLMLPPRQAAEEKWTGPKTSSEEAGASTGFSTLRSTETFKRELAECLRLNPKLYGLSRDPAWASTAYQAKVVDVAPKIAVLRMVKSAAEIAAIQKATDISVEAHRAAWRVIGPGLYEYQAAAEMVGYYLKAGCERSAYAPIVGSGPNSTTLHYSRNTRRMDGGELTVMDVGAECNHYASDITRTVPVNGKFTPRQREIYDVVLGAELAAIAAVKPGVTLGRSGLYRIAYDYINTHGKDRFGQPLGVYFTHGLSHHVGLDVHDASDNAVPLKAGMVITIEPGIYLPEENIGIRIEDTVLVTEDGARVMSAALPKDPDEMERALAQRH